jgi:hypothetical protein
LNLARPEGEVVGAQPLVYEPAGPSFTLHLRLSTSPGPRPIEKSEKNRQRNHSETVGTPRDARELS